MRLVGQWRCQRWATGPRWTRGCIAKRIASSVRTAIIRPSCCWRTATSRRGRDRRNLGEDYLAKWVTHYKQHAPRQLVTCASGWPYLAESHYHVMHAPLRQHRQFDQQAPETTKDYGQHVARYTVPLISHETGQWCVFPNLDEMQQYTGVLEAKNFEIVRDFLTQHGLLGQAHEFLMASGQLQKLLYKEEIEVMLRTPGFGGFQLLDMHDFPGAGHSPDRCARPVLEPQALRDGQRVPSVLRARRSAGQDCQPCVDQ